jgi:uncharacterized tellurite resistance protein B-like protein
MGLFDKLVSNKSAPLTPQAGLLLSAMTMSSVDGNIEDDERAIVQRLDRSGSDVDWDLAVKTWKENNVQDCISLSCAAMNKEQRITAIANLIDIAMADGILHGNEKQLLEAFIEAFEVDITTVEKIIDVVSIKNNKSIFA